MASAAFGKKTINKAVAKIVAMAKETPFVVTGVTSLDGSGKTDVSTDVLEKVADKVAAAAPECSFMIIAAGATHCSLVAHAPNDALSATDWIVACHVTDSDHGDERRAVGTYACEYPLKSKDQLNSLAFGLLRAKDLMQEESSEELPAFDLNASDDEEDDPDD